MSRTRCFAAFAALSIVAACSSTPPEGPPATEGTETQATETPKPPDPEAAQKVTDVTNQLEMARRKLERAQMDAEQGKIDTDAAVDKATVERDLAKKALKHFEEVESPQRIARAELDLKDSTDYMTEQQEEMEQLELMYSKDDLADKTKEIVLARGRRRLERAKQRLALAQKDNDDLRSTQLPEQRARLAQTLKERELDLARATFNAKTGRMDKETAMLAAQQEIDKLSGELEKAKKALAGGGSPGGSPTNLVDTDGDGFPDSRTARNEPKQK